YDQHNLYMSVNGGPEDRVPLSTAIYAGTGNLNFGGFTSVFVDGLLEQWFLADVDLGSAWLTGLYNNAAGAAYPWVGIAKAQTAPVVKLLQNIIGDTNFSAFPQATKLSNGTWRILYEYSTGGVEIPPMTVKQLSSTDGDNWIAGADLETDATVIMSPACPIYEVDILGNCIRFTNREDGTTDHIIKYTSTDYGATWDGGVVGVDATNGFNKFNYGFSRIRKVPGSSRLLMPIYGTTTTASSFFRIGIMKSDDSGATWQLLSTVAFDLTQHIDEPAIINVPGTSNWICVMRRESGAT